MIINGREVGFRYTVAAAKEMRRLVPDGNYAKFVESLQADDLDAIITIQELAIVFSEGYEKAKAFEAHQLGQTYEMHPLTMEELDVLDIEIFQELVGELGDTIQRDSVTTVRTEVPKGTKKKVTKIDQ